jgi:hypothetical protein
VPLGLEEAQELGAGVEVRLRAFGGRSRWCDGGEQHSRGILLAANEGGVMLCVLSGMELLYRASLRAYTTFLRAAERQRFGSTRTLTTFFSSLLLQLFIC